MKRHIHSARDLIIPFVDFFYPPFGRFMNLQTFRYAACGGANTVLGLGIYSFTFIYVLKQQTLHLPFYAITAHVAALFVSAFIGFFTGFFLMRYVVFSGSFLKGRVQFFRYLMLWIFCLLLNYILLKVFVERLHIHPILAQVMTIVIVVLFSYLSQKYYTFKAAPGEDVKNPD